MTSRTHDLAAVAFVSYRFLFYPLHTNWETLIGIGMAALIGGIIPDIDEVASPAWKSKLVPGDGQLTRDFLEGHRHLSHSLIGGALFTWVLGLALNVVKLPHVDVWLIQQAFALGILSHLVFDTITLEGVPWLFPIPLKFGFPPIRFLRIKTGGLMEKIVIFPGLLVFTIWIYVTHHATIARYLGM